MVIRWEISINYIVNEQIKLMADSVLRGLLSEISEIRSAPWFSLIADEALDVNYKEQMCVGIWNLWRSDRLNASTKNGCQYAYMCIERSLFVVFCHWVNV
jgi:hypothetical protein